jgi:hypothetical protein
MLTTAAVLITLAQAPQAPAPQTEYDKQFLTVEDGVTVTDGESSRTLVFTQGKYRRELSPPEFLRALGRDEQADSYQNRRTLARVLGVGAVASMLVGMLTVVAEGVRGQGGDCGPPSDPGFGACVEEMSRQIRAEANAGAAAPLLISAGIAAALFGGAIAVYPALPEPAELRRLADEHNQTLRQRLTGVSLRVDGRF